MAYDAVMGGAKDVLGSALTEKCALLLDPDEVVKHPPAVWLERLREGVKATECELHDAVEALCDAISMATIAVEGLQPQHRRKHAKNIIKTSVPRCSAQFVARLEVLAAARIKAGQTGWLDYARPMPTPTSKLGRLAAEVFQALRHKGALYTREQSAIAAKALRRAHRDVRVEDVDAALDLLNRARSAALAFDHTVLMDERKAAYAARELHKKFPALERQFCGRLIAEAQFLMR